MFEELIIQIKCIYIIIGVLEAGDHYVKIPFTTIIADFEISKYAMVYLYVDHNIFDHS